MRIGELARRTGVSERSLRYYETQGLLRSERTPGGQRHYPEGAVDRVIRIQELFAAGLSSRKIARLLPCLRDADGGPSEIATPRLVTELTAERERINQMIVDLLRSREVLDEVIDVAAGGVPRTGSPRRHPLLAVLGIHPSGRDRTGRKAEKLPGPRMSDGAFCGGVVTAGSG